MIKKLSEKDQEEFFAELHGKKLLQFIEIDDDLADKLNIFMEESGRDENGQKCLTGELVSTLTITKRK